MENFEFILLYPLYVFQNVSSGMKLWGVIAEVNEKDIVVSLPGGLRGLVRAGDAFDPIPGDEVKGVFFLPFDIFVTPFQLLRIN